MDGSYVDGMNPSQSLDEDGMPYAGDPSIGPGAGTPLPRPHIRSFVMEAEASESVEAVSLLLRHNAELQDMWRFESESNKGLRRLVVQASDALDSLASQHEMFHATLSDGLATFTTQQSFDSLFQAAVQRLCTMLSADRATVFLLDETKDELWSRCAVGVGGDGDDGGDDDAKRGGGAGAHESPPRFGEIRISRHSGVAGYVASTGTTVNLSRCDRESMNHPHWNLVDQSVSKISGYHMQSMVCAPSTSAEGTVGGVAQVRLPGVRGGGG
jgi:hypothetical protein